MLCPEEHFNPKLKCSPSNPPGAYFATSTQLAGERRIECWARHAQFRMASAPIAA